MLMAVRRVSHWIKEHTGGLLLRFLDDGVVLLFGEFTAESWFPRGERRMLLDAGQKC